MAEYNAEISITVEADNPEYDMSGRVYRWATADETERHLNETLIAGAIWVRTGPEATDLAVPVGKQHD